MCSPQSLEKLGYTQDVPFPIVELTGAQFVQLLLSPGPSQSHPVPNSKWRPTLYEGLVCSVPVASPCGPNSCRTLGPTAHSVPATRGQIRLSFLWQPGCPRRAAAGDAHHLHPESSRECIRRGEDRKRGLTRTPKRTWQEGSGAGWVTAASARDRLRAGRSKTIHS